MLPRESLIKFYVIMFYTSFRGVYYYLKHSASYGLGQHTAVCIGLR